MSDIVERLRFAGSLLNAPSSQKAEFHGAADEIEELRAVVERLEAENEAMAKHTEAVQITWDGCDSERMELRARVEELEQWKRDDMSSAKYYRRTLDILDKQHRITNEQIDAAWKWVPDVIVKQKGMLVEPALAELNIYRCACNNGIYTEGNDDGSQTADRVCEVCNKHGWVTERR